MRAIGLDIGSSSIAALALDSDTGAVLDSVTAANDAGIATGNPWESLQSPERIWEVCKNLSDALIARHGPVASMGISNQMHGVLYVDAGGEAVSPLYTWQDSRADQSLSGGGTYVDALYVLTGVKVAAGYGLATHFYNIKNNLVPTSAAKLCTIGDYIAMRLCGERDPVTHSSNAASLGFFDLKKRAFDTAALNRAGIGAAILPAVTPDIRVFGDSGGIPVAVAVGDNQASFLGSVSSPRDSILVNIGTGSQITFMPGAAHPDCGLEPRPLDGAEDILVGCGLCGGSSYALLAKFFREVTALSGGDAGSMYPLMDSLALGWRELENPLTVSTLFKGSRADPTLRGSITGIGTDNLMPQHLVIGFIRGMAQELYDFYASYPGDFRAKRLVGSGNAIRLGLAQREILSHLFEMPLFVPAHREEAAYGAAIASLVAEGTFKSLEDAGRIIKYEEVTYG